MKVKSIFQDRFHVVATLDKDGGCLTEDFLFSDDNETLKARTGLVVVLEYVAAKGLDACPPKWVHAANADKTVFEFIKGNLRLFFFKGKDGQIAVCTSGVRKKGQKADARSVERAEGLRKDYLQAYDDGALEVITESDDENE